MISWILAPVGVAVFVVLVCVAIGFFLPKEHVASSSRMLSVKPDRVFALVTGMEGLPRWNPMFKKVEKLNERGGHHGNDHWRVQGSFGVMTFEVLESEAPKRFVTRIADPDLPFGGSWTYEIGTVPTGSTLTITENGEIRNPLFRFLSRFVFGHTQSLNRYLDAAAKELSKPQ